MNFTEIHPSHEDIVNDIVFDCHGKRFATCSNDRHIRVWEKEEQSDTWLFVDFPKGHKDSVWRLSWADPEYGQIIASCGEDGSICIFEEHLPITASESATWVKKVQLAISKKAVNDVKFAQKKFGLILATASADGYVRIYEATDIFDLSNWEKLVSQQVEDTTNAGSTPTNPRTNPTNESDEMSSPNAPSIEQEGPSPKNAKKPVTIAPSEHGLTCVAWNPCQFEPAMLVVGGYSKRAVVLAMSGNSLVENCILGEHLAPVHDVAWAPAMGRSFHLIASASREPCFRIHMLERLEGGNVKYVSTQVIDNVASSDSASKSNIWRVSWNATGTVLATSAENGDISLWRRNFSGEWINVQNVPSADQMQRFYPNPNWR